MIFSGLIGWVVWHNTPGLLSLVGVLLVTAGGVLSTRFSGPNSQGHFGWVGLLESSCRRQRTRMNVRAIKGENVRCVLPVAGDRGRISRLALAGTKPLLGRYSEETDSSLRSARADNQTFDLPEIVTCIAPRAAGGLVLTLKKHFAIYDPVTRSWSGSREVERDLPNNRFNDGKCDPAGRFWAGTMDAVHWSASTGNLFRHGIRGELSAAMQPNVICSNGSGWSPDGRRMYYTESFRYAIFVYDFDPRREPFRTAAPFATIDSNSGGFPDGMTVDADGFVWSNVVGLGQIHRYDPQGKLERILQLPVPRATDCTFGGPDLKTLYVTRRAKPCQPDQLAAAPLSGSLFAVDCDVRGLPSQFVRRLTNPRRIRAMQQDGEQRSFRSAGHRAPLDPWQ